MEKKTTPTFCPASQQEWRKWLEENHQAEQSVWLVQHKKKTNVSSVSWGDAVDEALCFGWIDSIRKSIDGDRFIQFFGKRKPRSAWSKINKAKVERLIAEGLMWQAGLDSIAVAKQNGSWGMLDKVEELKIPKELAAAFKANPGSKKYFLCLSKSVKKAMLQWIAFAKRPETKAKRITEIATLAAQRQRPKQF